MEIISIAIVLLIVFGPPAILGYHLIKNIRTYRLMNKSDGRRRSVMRNIIIFGIALLAVIILWTVGPIYFMIGIAHM